MILVDFLRHGSTDASGRLLGRTDAPLSAEGRRAVEGQVAGRSWQVIVTSPLVRAQESAAIAATASSASIEIAPDWREIDFGDWDGAPLAELARDPRFTTFQVDAEANSPPNGEPMSAVRERVARALDHIAAQDRSRVLVVAHGGTIRAALSILLAIPFERLWAFRISCATRITVQMGSSAAHGLWGEVIEIAQPVEAKENE
jgi:alpha-ribazole phosphatase